MVITFSTEVACPGWGTGCYGQGHDDYDGYGRIWRPGCERCGGSGRLFRVSHHTYGAFFHNVAIAGALVRASRCWQCGEEVRECERCPLG